MDLSETLKEKVYNAFEEQRYIGNVFYSEDEYQELLNYSKNYARTLAFGGGYYLNGDDKIHFATLIEIAKRWKDDEDSDRGFWKYVFNILLNNDDNPKLWRAFTDLISGLEYEKTIPVAESCAKKYYATIMMHAFAPNNSINSFLDFVYNIYKKDLDFNYSIADKELCEMAAQGFCDVAKKLGSKNLGVSIGSGVYGIKIGLRCMALGKDTHADFLKLLDTTLKAVDSLYHGKKPESSDYFVGKISNWWENKSDGDVIISTTKQDSATTKQNITAKFVCSDSNVYLRILPIRFASGENPKLWLSIFIGNNTDPIISEEVFTRVGEITVTSVQQDILLNQIFKNSSPIDIRIELSDNGKSIFNKILKREFILFDSEKEVSDRILKTNNYFMYATRIDDLQLPIAVNSVAKNLYNIYPTDGESVSGETVQVMFINDIESTTGPNKIRLACNSNKCRWVYEQQEYNVFPNKVSLIIPTNISVNSLQLSVGETKRLLSDMSAIRNGSYYLYEITDLVDLYRPTKIILYSYLKEKEVLNEDIILIKYLRISFSESVYYDNYEKSVRISIGSKYKDITWNLGDEYAICSVCHGRLLVDIPLLKWRIDNGDWFYGAINDIFWYKDYFNSGSVLEVQSTYDIIETHLYCIGDGKTQEIPLNTYSKFEIGKYIYDNEGKKSLTFFLMTETSKRRFKILETTTISGFSKNPPFEVANEKIRFIGEQTYIGERVPFFVILLQCIGKDDVKVKSTDLINGVLEEIEENNYWIKITALSDGLFVKEEKVLWEGEYIFGDSESNALKNKVLKIKPICGIGNGDFWKMDISGYYVSELVRETPNANNGVYLGKLYYKKAGGECVSVDGFSKCRVEIISSIALRVYVKDENGEYTRYMKCNSNGGLYGPDSQSPFTAYNYHFVEVKNV